MITINQDIITSACVPIATILQYFYVRWITILDTLCQNNMFILVTFDINQIVHPKISHQIGIFTFFFVNFGVHVPSLPLGYELSIIITALCGIYCLV